MGKKVRLDKLLANVGFGTRSEVKRLVKNGSVLVNDRVAKDSGMQVDPENDSVVIEGETLQYREFIYVMLNKPAGVISATEDVKQRTVIDLLSPEYRSFSLFPVGRLDKDTEGLLILTNDGQLAHQLLSPKKHVKKTYYAEVEGFVDEADVHQFREGVMLADGYKTLPAKLTILQHEEQDMDNEWVSQVQVEIVEGKYHQVKRMFAACGKHVKFLKRLEMGGVVLDPGLKQGQYRELTEAELQCLKKGQ